MSAPAPRAGGHRRTLLLLAGLSLGMFGFGFALVPLYGLLCELTGAPSVAQRAAGAAAGEGGAAPAQAPDQGRWVTVKFDGTVHPDLPWSFEPGERQVRIHPGALQEVSFRATNRSSRPVTGQALPSVVPWQATAFFNKLECFCFRSQTLAGGETREMPLRFVVSPDLPQGIQSLTLSYSFMRGPEQTQVASR